jgi:sarcosine oxidase subunit gamma
MARATTPRKTAAKKAPRRAAVKAPAIAINRVSPLDGIITYGRGGADHAGGPGVQMSVRHAMSIATVIARKGKMRSLNNAMKKHYGVDCPTPGQSASARGVDVHWCGPEQWYVISQKHDEGALFGELRGRLEGMASVSEQSHGRIIISLKGSRVRELLAKGTPVDLHPREFGPGQCAVTQMAHVGVHIAQVGKDQFELSLFRGFAESFWQRLTEMASEYGYEVV